jgi:hypothetical protein
MSTSVETNRATTVSWFCVPATGIKGRAIVAASPASAAGAVASTAVTAGMAGSLKFLLLLHFFVVVMVLVS